MVGCPPADASLNLAAPLPGISKIQRTRGSSPSNKQTARGAAPASATSEANRDGYSIS
jgi:hypothetical protein